MLGEPLGREERIIIENPPQKSLPVEENLSDLFNEG